MGQCSSSKALKAALCQPCKPSIPLIQILYQLAPPDSLESFLSVRRVPVKAALPDPDGAEEIVTVADGDLDRRAGLGAVIGVPCVSLPVRDGLLFPPSIGDAMLAKSSVTPKGTRFGHLAQGRA